MKLLLLSFEADRISLHVLQKSSKWRFYPLSAAAWIAYCVHNILEMRR